MTLLTTAFAQGTHAARPAAAAGNAGYYYYETDTQLLFQSTGSAWQQIASSGGATSPLTTKGDVWGYSTANARIPVGADGTVLTADSTQALGVKWGAAAGGGAGTWRTEVAPWMLYTVVQGTWVLLVNTSTFGNGLLHQSGTGALNDEIQYTLGLTAGTYSVGVMYDKVGSGGIVTVSLGGTSLGTIDTYNAALQANQVATFTGATVAATGSTVLDLKMTGQNASSTGFVLDLVWITLQRTA